MQKYSPPPLWFVILSVLTLCACADVSGELSGESSRTEEASILLRIPAFDVETVADVASIEVYQFSDGCFVKKMTLDPSKENTVEFPRRERTRIFALAAHSIDGKERQSESEFSSMTIPMPKGSHSAPVFFSSVTEIHEGSTHADIELRRGVARLDIANNDPDLMIEKVSVYGAASSTQIFPMDGRTCECACESYTRTYEEGIEGVAERAFVLFETSSPITVTVFGRRKGEAVEISTETPAIARNTLYTVTIEKGKLGTSKERMSDSVTGGDYDDDCKTTVSVSDWEHGDVQSGFVDLEESAIDMQRSYIPAGVRVNSSDNTITVPADGLSGMKLAFVTGSPLRLGSVLSENDGVKVTPMDPKTSAEGYVSEFRVDVAGQPKCGLKYQATVFFNGSSNFFINIEVDPSPYQIPTVRIGGHDWMCFNAVSQNPDDQVFLPKGMTVEKMYTDRFLECMGNYFQHGKPNPFSPWKAYDPACFSDQPRDVPWARQSMMPLPKGYHVASRKEWEDLIPSGTIVPSTYRTPAGETIRATVYTFPGTLDGTPSASTNAQKYLKRCVLLESLTTGAKLCLPMAGIKTNTSVEVPSHPNFRFETLSGYWMKEDKCVMKLNYARQSDGTEGIELERSLWNADGFVMVRGIKD